MKRWARTFGILAALLAVAWVGVLSSRIDSGQYQFTQTFTAIPLGTYRNELLNTLGPPDEIWSDLRFARKDGFRAIHDRALNSRSVEYLIWVRGKDVTYIVGLDADGYVSLREYGSP